MAIDLTLAALADPTRRELLRRLARKRCRASDLADGFPVSRPAICKHTRVLRKAGLVRATRSGRERVYELAPGGREVMGELMRQLARVGSFWDTALGAFKRFIEEER